MSMLANFLKRDTDGHLRLLVMILLAVSLSVSQSFADVGDEEEYYDEFEDTSFEFADEDFEPEVRDIRRGRIISRSYIFEGPYLGFLLQHSGGVVRDNASRRERDGSNANNAVQAAGDGSLNAFSDNSGFGMFLGVGEVFERHRIYLGGEFGASITKKSYDYNDDQQTYSGTNTTPTSDMRSRTVNMDYDLDFSARMGYLVQPYHLFYTQVGYSMGFYDIASRGSSEVRGSRDIAHAWNFGFGSEIAIGDRSALRFGWLVRDYDDSLDALDTRDSISRDAVLMTGTGDNRQYAARTYSLQVGFTFYPGSEGEHKNMKVRGGVVGDGVYGGALFHHSNAAYNESDLTNWTTTSATSNTRTNKSNDFGQDFFGWAGFVGYGFDMGRVFERSQLDGIYLGSEIEFGSPTESEVAKNYSLTPGATTGTGQSRVNNCTVRSDVFKRHSDVALLGRLGYRFTPQTLVYLKGGYGWTQFENENHSSNFSATGDTLPCDSIADATLGTSSVDVDKYRLGSYRIGLGVESVLYDNLFMRMDWTYLDHEERNVTVRGRDGVQDGRILNYGGFDDNRISLGLGYTFDGLGPL